MAGVLFQGTFGADDQVQYFHLTVNSATNITFQSFGYAGGTDNATVILSGGFAPELSLFALVGGDYVLANSDNGGHCGITGADLVTSNCDDPYLQTVLAPGSYYVALSGEAGIQELEHNPELWSGKVTTQGGALVEVSTIQFPG